MISKLLLIPVSIITLASCSTAYKTGQTPDDVYYSPIRTYGEEVRKEEDKKEEAQNRDVAEERQIRMRTYDRRWRYFDNDISYNPYSYGYNYGYYYNPFYYSYPVYNTCACNCTPSNPKTSTPRMTNLGGYGNGYNYNNTTAGNTKLGGPVTGTPVRTYNNGNSSNNQGSKLGNTLNKIFNNSNSSSDNNSSNSSRTYTPSSSSSSSSSSGSSTSRPARSGRN